MKNQRAPEPAPTKAVGIWIRVSTEDQAKGESPEHHEQRARFYAEELKKWVKVSAQQDGFHGHQQPERLQPKAGRHRYGAILVGALPRQALRGFAKRSGVLYGRAVASLAKLA